MPEVLIQYLSVGHSIAIIYDSYKVSMQQENLHGDTVSKDYFECIFNNEFNTGFKILWLVLHGKKDLNKDKDVARITDIIE